MMRVRRALHVGCLIVALAGPALGAEAGKAPDAPWWDRFPTLYQTGDVARAARSHASAMLCGAADDPTWGIFGQRQRIATSRAQIADAHKRGIKALSWFEGFGTAGLCYIGEVRRDALGRLIKTQEDPNLTRLFHLHWDWQTTAGEGEVVWVGAHNTFDNDAFARPYTRTHPRYGMPPMRYPDGRIASGATDPTDPRTHRVYDAGASKDVLGRVTFEYEYNDALNRIQPATGKPLGPLRGLVQASEAPAGVPDPGFTPEQWRAMKRPRYAGAVCPGKDSACPSWIDYARGSVRAALDAGIDGLWVDNWSPWDSFNARPLLKAFGDWSVEGFRKRKGVDIRAYLQQKVRTWGGDPANLDDPKWLDPRWRDDPIWRAYLGYKRRTGTSALSAMYRTLKREADAAGKPDFLVSGNDIPGYSLGWARGDLDMVSTELTWGWSLTGGPRGLMPPPLGSCVPVYRLAREHAKSRFVNLWMYGPDEAKKKPGIANVCYYQGLASHALPMPLPGATIGTDEADAAFFGFVRRAAPLFGNRLPVEQVGLYYSSSSQLMEMLPGGFRDHGDQPHSFSFYGWGAALTMLHVPWRALPEWKITDGELAGLTAVIIPSAEVFPREDLPVLKRWVQRGGRLLIAGPCGLRLGEGADFAPAPAGGTLAMPLGSMGKGSALRVADDPGRSFYAADKARPVLLAGFHALLSRAGCPTSGFALASTDAPWTVGLTLFSSRGRLFVDVNNTDIDLPSDRITPAPPVTFTVQLPPDLRGKRLRVRVISPQNPAPEARMSLRGAAATVMVASVELYASVVIEAAPAR
jgi:hypothetical protein